MKKSLFAQRLVVLREQKGLSQDILAEHFSVTRQAVGKWEKGSIPREPILSGLADLFNVTVDYLLGRDDIKQPKGEIKLTPIFSSKDEVTYDVEITGDPEINDEDREIIKQLMKELPAMSKEEKKKMIPMLQAVVMGIRNMKDD